MVRRWTTRRRWLLACLAVAALSAIAALCSLPPDDPLEAACRRVPLSADREAVEAAVGWPPDAVVNKLGRDHEWSRRVLTWECDDDMLLVEFDEDGRAVQAWTRYWHEPTPWERFVAWLRR